MLKIKNVVKDEMKIKTNMFFQDVVAAIGHIDLYREASVNELIANYVKESAMYKMNPATDDIGNAYLNVATLLAFIERITTPSKKPSSIDEILSNENFNTADRIAECTGLFAKSVFECHEKKADVYLAYMAVLVKKLLQEEDDEISDDCSDPDNSDASEQLSEEERAALAEQKIRLNEEPVPKEWAIPV